VDRLGGERLTVLQFDAHTDLRPEYEGTRHSHAAVMHQVHEAVDIVAVGIRALTREEAALAKGATGSTSSTRTTSTRGTRGWTR
jgi:arginase family enzyme